MFLLLFFFSWSITTALAQFVVQAQKPEFRPDLTWDLGIGPGLNDTANLVFNTVHSLLLGWPNRRYRNGHTVVPGVIPTGTFLYHGRGDPVVPTHPEWTALDFELSTLYCGLFTPDGEGCWHLTLVAERPLNILYFDGYSGLKLPGSGTLDSQDVLAWGEVMPDRYHDEPQRIVDLCKWGQNFGLDGFVRLHTSYEVMLCDFSSGLKVKSMLHINIPYLPPSPNISSHLSSAYQNTIAPGMKLGVPLDSFGMGELLASKRIDEYPGETRIQLHLHRLVSFYDTELVPSLISTRFGKHRLQHRILGISHSDIQAVRHRVQIELSTSTKSAHDIAWSSLFRAIVQQYAARLELIQHDLNSTDRSIGSLSTTLRATFLQLRGLLQPYDLVSTRAAVDGTKDKLSWVTQVYEMCATAYPTFSSASGPANFTTSENLMLTALKATNREICRVITSMWADGISHQLENPLASSHNTRMLFRSIHKRWKEDIDSLMLWLDWSVWLKCNPSCSLNEMCYLPMSPYLVPGADPADDWITQARDPRPTCVPKHSR